MIFLLFLEKKREYLYLEENINFKNSCGLLSNGGVAPTRARHDAGLFFALLLNNTKKKIRLYLAILQLLNYIAVNYTMLL
jgi:hypothetical protein